MTLSCAEDFRGYSNNELGQEQIDTSELPNFSSRLSTELAIEGEKCFGGEVVESGGEIFTCQLSQWLITVDNINTCSPEGCTEIFVQPIIANLRKGLSGNNVTFYSIIPSIPINDKLAAILTSVIVRFSNNEAPRVEFK